MRFNLLLLFFLISFCALAQDHGFPFGQVTYRELEMRRYEKDTSANAVVLNEFGETYIQDGDHFNLIHEYHVKIKILKQEGVEDATVEIPLYKSSNGKEKLNTYKASSFNIENGSIKETKLDTKNVFEENTNKYWSVVKIAIPNARVGTIIEYQYQLESPFFYKFRSWDFQSKNPKVKSDYLALIPANYTYNITLRGFLKLSNQETKLIRQCFYQGRADCSQIKFSMVNIPAFVEEDYMTAKSNFISAINFELSQVQHFDGQVVKYTEEWRDVDQKMQRDEDFGIQLKKGKDLFKVWLDPIVKNNNDSSFKSRQVFDFIKGRFQWNENNGSFCENGIKKALEERKGNVADINLSLVAALRYAGINADPVILSTRSNGLPVELHPVLSDFNYVVAKVTLNSKTYLLDATDDFSPFGILPTRCLNGKGRVMNEKGSYWIELKAADKAKKISNYSLVINEKGALTGSIQIQYSGYEAIDRRKAIASFNSEEAYIEAIKKKQADLNIVKMEIIDVDDLSRPVTEKYEIEMEDFVDLSMGHFLFNPFMEEKIKNPFKSNERLYPVDFGSPVEETMIFSLSYPEKFEPSGLPDKVAISLPNSGGRFLFGVQNLGNKITMNNTFTINRTVYSSEEYHFLKEFYNRMIQVQESDWVFKKKQ